MSKAQKHTISGPRKILLLYYERMRFVHSLLLLGLLAAAAPTIGSQKTGSDPAELATIMRADDPAAFAAVSPFRADGFLDFGIFDLIERKWGASPAPSATSRGDAEDDDTDEEADARESCALAAFDPLFSEGLPRGLVPAIALTESAFNALAVGTRARAYHPDDPDEARRILGRYGRSAAAGCMQIHRRWHDHSVENLLDPRYNVAAASEFLLYLKAKHGDWKKAVGAYHGGDAATRADYVCRVRARMIALGGDAQALAARCSERNTRRHIATARRHLDGLRTKIVTTDGST
ncbi:MAG: lytic transglycosylase domain-containing protein [Azospirillum sp.]|nr:lytic transglycosylase domain-containing protein [Azospirillum sp.]